MAKTPPGSYLTISHGTGDLEPDKVAEAPTRLNSESYQQYTFRSKAEVARFFDGLELVEPGLVHVEEWRPTIESSRTTGTWAGVGRKPG